jgi:glycerophosphoryl diester phosphodiesterase
MHPFLAGLSPTLLIAHRGGAGLAPENTMAAFEMAVDRFCADMLELDVHVTRDGEPVVAHDAAVDRCTDGQGAIADLTMAEVERLDAGYRFTSDGVTYPYRGLGLRIPRLSQVLGRFGVRLNIELKPTAPGPEALLAAEIRRAGAAGRTCVGSADDQTGVRLLRALPEACHFYPREALSAVYAAVQVGAAPADSPYLVLDIPLYLGGVRLLGEPLLRWARGAGRWINVWTVDDQAEMRRLVAEGVGGIMTDRPDRLREVLAEVVSAS